MRTIFKYAMPVCSTGSVRVPLGAELLSIQIQNEEVFGWFKFDPSAELSEEKIYYHVVGTGHKFHERYGRYVATIQMGAFVWHYFLESPSKEMKESV